MDNYFNLLQAAVPYFFLVKFVLKKQFIEEY